MAKSVVFAMVAKKAVREGLGTRLVRARVRVGTMVRSKAYTKLELGFGFVLVFGQRLELRN